MKQGKAPTRNQREILLANGLFWKDYEVLYYESEFYMKVRNKDTGHIKIIDKLRRVKL